MLSLSCLSKRFGGLVVTDRLSLTVNLGEIYALIGPNGAGKTTLIQQISGAIKPDDGRIMMDGEDVTPLPPYERARLGLKRSYQISSLLLDFTVLENVTLAAASQHKIGWRIFHPLLRETNPRNEALSCLARLGLSELQNRKLRELGHGERRQVELAMALVGRPRILLLDEPAAGLSPAETQQVSALLRQIRPDYAILLVEHDMNLVFGVADRIGVLVNGRLIAEDIPGKIADNPDVRAAYLGQESDHLAGDA